MALFKFSRAQTTPVQEKSDSQASEVLSGALKTANAPLAQKLNPFSSVGKPSVPPAVDAGQGPIAPASPKKRSITLFSDETDMKNKMIADGMDEDTANSQISDRRKELFGGDATILPKEAEMMLKMQADGISAKDAVAMIKQRREDTGDVPGKTSLAQKAFNVGAGAASLAAEQVGNVLDFAIPGEHGFKQDLEDVKNAIEPIKDQAGFQTGRNIFGVGESIAATPAKLMTSAGIAKTIPGRMAQGAAVAGSQGAAMPILDTGSDATLGDIAMSGTAGAALGALAVPAIEKGLIPAVGALSKPVVSGMKNIAGKISNIGNTPAVDSVAPVQTMQKMGKNVFDENVAPVEIDKPGIISRAMNKIEEATGSEPDIGRLVNDALKTKQSARLTPKDQLAKIQDSGYVTDLEQLHGLVSSGKIEGDLNSVLGGADAVQKGLQVYGQKIGQALKDAGLDSTVDVSISIGKLDKILADKRGAIANPEITALAEKYKKLLSEFNTLENIQATKQDLFQDLANIKKENIGRQSYRDFMDASQELINAIDNKVEQATGNSAQFIQDKKIYKSLKNIEKDITASAVISQRGSQQRLVEQLADMQIGLDSIRNPVSAVTAKMSKEVSKAIADRTSRDGSFRRAMEQFNKRAKARGEISGKIQNAPKPDTNNKPDGPSPGKGKSSGNASLDAIISESKNAGVDMEKYLANTSEASANKMADYAYKYAIDRAVEGKNTLNFDKIGKINEALKTGKEGVTATVGDVITDPYLRKLYKDALSTPIEVSKTPGTEGSIGEFVIEGPKKGTIIFRAGNTDTEYNLADTILHEAAHSIRSSKGRTMTNDYTAPAIPKGNKGSKGIPPKK